MNQEKKTSREYVEAIPGPTIVISRDTYQKMQNDHNSQQNQDKLKKYEKFFERIKDETKLPNDEDFTL